MQPEGLLYEFDTFRTLGTGQNEDMVSCGDSSDLATEGSGYQAF